MLLPGLKYMGKKEVGLLTVLTLPPTDPKRKQLFKKGEVKLIGKEISQEIAKYLVSEYRGVVEFVDVEVDGKVIFEEEMKKVRHRFASHMEKDDLHSIFCDVFNINIATKLKVDNERQAKEIANLQKSLKELNELKSVGDKKTEDLKKSLKELTGLKKEGKTTKKKTTTKRTTKPKAK